MKEYRFQNVSSKHRLSQDQCLLLRQGDTLIIAVADGNGYKSYVRSGLGARFACGAAVKVLRRGVATQDFPEAVKTLFDSYVSKHLALRPLKDWERKLLGDLPESHAYGTTLLAAELTPTGTRLFQLGDGEIHLIDNDGKFYGLEADEHCRGNRTTSMVQRTNTVISRFRRGEFPPCAAIMLFTDGFDSVIDATQTLLDPDTVEEALTKALRLHDSGDDQTLVLAVTEEIREEGFRRGLEASLENLRAYEAWKSRMAVLWEEYDGLTDYLRSALKTLGEMKDTRSPGYVKLAQAARENNRRYLALQKLLNQKGESPCL